MAELEGKVPGEDTPRTAQMEAGDVAGLGKLILSIVLGTGAAVIGKLAPNSGVDIGDVTLNNVAGVTDVPVEVQNEVEVVQSAYADLKGTVQVNGAVVLGTGTKTIGDLNDILGDLPTSIQGPANPTFTAGSAITPAVINLAASTADQELVAAQGSGKAIWVYGIFCMADTAAGTITFQDEDNTAHSGTIALSDEGGFVLPFSGNFNVPWIKVAANKALEADTGACTVDGILLWASVEV